MSESIPYGYCQCGCGERTTIATMTSAAKGVRAGEPNRYVNPGHARRGVPSWNAGSVRRPIDERDYRVEDRGYLTPCWIWQLWVNEDGYGSVTIAGKGQGAHLAIFKQAGGIVPSGWHVDHLCRVRDCINPAHLEAVTPQENGRRQINVKLTREQVEEIRETTEPSAIVAQRYPVNERQIRRIRQGVRWS